MRRLIDELAAVSTSEVRLTGGELALYPELFPLLDAIARAEMACSVITNGTLFKDQIFDRLVAAPISHFLVSLDSPYAEVHDRIRSVPRLFETASTGIRRLRVARPQARITINMVISAQTLDHIAAAAELASELEVDCLNLLPIKDWDEMQPTLEQIRDYNAALPGLLHELRRCPVRLVPSDLNIYGQTDAETAESARGRYPARGPCHVPFFEAFVDCVTGDVWPCNSTPYEARKAHACGNLHSQSFAEIWTGSSYQRLRSAFAQADPVPCSQKCDPLNACNSSRYAELLSPNHS